MAVRRARDSSVAGSAMRVPWQLRLATNLQNVLRRRGALDELRFLLYLSNLTEADAAQLRLHGEGIVWPGKA